MCMYKDTGFDPYGFGSLKVPLVMNVLLSTFMKRYRLANPAAYTPNSNPKPGAAPTSLPAHPPLPVVPSFKNRGIDGTSVSFILP